MIIEFKVNYGKLKTGKHSTISLSEDVKKEIELNITDSEYLFNLFKKLQSNKNTNQYKLISGGLKDLSISERVDYMQLTKNNMCAYSHETKKRGCFVTVLFICKKA